MHGVGKKIKLVTEYALTEGLWTWNNNKKKKQTNWKTKMIHWDENNYYTLRHTVFLLSGQV